MAKPAILQDLWHGGFLSKKIYPFFVETWNYITRRIENLKGDKDENPAQGYITVDNTNPERPIIRFSPSNNWYTKVDSELTDLSLSSIERTGLSGNSHIQLFDFDNLNNQVHPTQLSNYDFIARYTDSNDNTYLKYVTLSSLSSSAKISGDANYDEYEDDRSVSVNITSDDTSRITLYNFGETSTDDYYEFNGQDNIFLQNYWNGLNTYISAFNEDSWQCGQFLTRKRVNGQYNQLRYSPIALKLPRYSLGDSNYGEMYKSISSWVAYDEPQYSLYNIGKESDFKSINICCDDFTEYYDNGYTGTQSKIENEDNFKVLVRRYNQGVYYIDYVDINNRIPPFVHGDGDEYDETLDQFSIDSKPDYQHPDKTYYQLHKFDDGSYYDEIDVELLSDDYVNLATGNKSGQGGDEDYDFLVRHTNSNGTFLEYRHINLKGDGAGEGGQVIERIENIEENINVISNDINDLSSQISGLSGDFWKKGGDCYDNYGSTIGDDNQTAKIDLNNNTLLGDWSASDSFTSQGDLTCFGDGMFYNSIDVYDTVKSDKVEVTNTIKIGNTTLDENQLQQLLALLNSSTNVMNQRY